MASLYPMWDLAIHNKLESSYVNGPGNRAVIWVQGCMLACPGCWNPDTHAFKQNTLTNHDELVSWINRQKDIEGVTFSGGEPLHQIVQICRLIEDVKMSRKDLSFGIFTGYTLQEAQDGNYKSFHFDETINEFILNRPDFGTYNWIRLKENLDFAIMGRYNKKLPSTNPMLGSSNQMIWTFDRPDGTSRYTTDDFGKTQQMEVQISDDGYVAITGFPTFHLEERVI